MPRAHGPYKGPMGHGAMGPGPGGPARAEPRAGATLGAGPLRFQENPQEKQHPEKTTLWVPDKTFLSKMFEIIAPKNESWAQMGPGPKRALIPHGPWAQTTGPGFCSYIDI